MQSTSAHIQAGVGLTLSCMRVFRLIVAACAAVYRFGVRFGFVRLRFAMSGRIELSVLLCGQGLKTV